MYPLPVRKHRIGLRWDSNQPGQLVYVHQYMNADALPSIVGAGRLPEGVGLLVLLPGTHAQRFLLFIAKAMGDPKLIKERLPFLVFLKKLVLLGGITQASARSVNTQRHSTLYTTAISGTPIEMYLVVFLS